MIDIHSHTLFGVDDGCFMLETSIQTLKEEAQCGVTDVFCTPHIDTYDFDVELFRNNFNILEEKVKEENINITLHKGAEIGPNFTPSILMKKNIDLTMGESGKYVLIGPFFGPTFSKTSFDAVLYDLQMLGKIPIIANPERMSYFQEDPEQLTTFLNRGCLLQMNGPSLLGKYGETCKEFAHKILKLGWISFVATDNHHPHSYSMLHKAYSHIKTLYGEPLAKELIVTNPQKVINNQPMVKYDYDDWVEEKKKKSFWGFLFNKDKK